MSEAIVTKPRGRVIPATIHMFSQTPLHSTKKQRVTAYARVSTSSEEQESSYEAQKEYYTRYIQSKPDWAFVELYADEGLSGLMMKNRKDFNRMIQDAVDGKIDLILVKSISRFARNSVDTLNTVRLLKQHNVEVLFEKDNISSFDPKAELVLSILASLAQEESRNISENVQWGKRKRFADGAFTLPYKQFLGFEKGEDGKPKIVEKEAAIVCLIYDLYLNGRTPVGIANHLEKSGTPSPTGKTKWSTTTVESILKNEKYKGDALLQKTFTLDYLTKTRKSNEGELAQYYHTGTHPAIIPPAAFDYVQTEMARRKALGRNYSDNGFASRVVCGECGCLYGGKVWYSNNEKYRRTIYRCNNKYGGGKKCSTPHFSAEEIKRAFLAVYNRMLPNRLEIVEVCREAVCVILNTDKLQNEHETLTVRMGELSDELRKLIAQNASAAQNQDEYNVKQAELVMQFERIKERRSKVETELTARKARAAELAVYLDELERSGELLTTFDERTWNLTVETCTVQREGSMVFRFKEGAEQIWR